MRYIQYFRASKDKAELIKVPKTLPIDGRWRISRCLEEAIEKSKPEHEAFQIFDGEKLGSILKIKEVMNFI